MFSKKKDKDLKGPQGPGLVVITCDQEEFTVLLSNMVSLRPCLIKTKTVSG